MLNPFSWFKSSAHLERVARRRPELEELEGRVLPASRLYVTPGEPGEMVTVRSRFLSAHTGFRNEVVLADGSLYITDTVRHEIVRVSPDGASTVVAGTGIAGFNGDGAALQTRFNTPSGLAAGPPGSYEVPFLDEGGVLRTRRVFRPILYIADFLNHRIRELQPTAGGELFVHTIAGTGTPGAVSWERRRPTSTR